jgi:hypothetical protein
VHPADAERRDGCALVGLGLLAVVILALAAFWAWTQGWFSAISVGDVRAWREAELPVGAPSAEVEAFFLRHGIAWYGPPDAQGWYDGRLSDAGPCGQIMVGIQVDAQGRVLGDEIHDNCAFP